MTAIAVTDPGLVILVGCSGSGKSTLARRLFAEHEIVSLDHYRAVISGSRYDLSATKDAADMVAEIVERRLRRRLLTVVDATNVRSEDRRRWIESAEKTHSLVTAVVLDPDLSFCHRNAEERDGERYSAKALSLQASLFKRDRRKLKHEGIRNVVTLQSPREIENAELVRKPVWNDRRHDHGPFDVVGDIHGATDEAEELLARLGWAVTWSGEGEDQVPVLSHPEGRKLVFLGDVVDRGPRSRDALLLMESAVKSGVGYAVASNHDHRFMRWLLGNEVTMGHGLELTVAEFEGTSEEYRRRLGEFLYGLQAQLVFDGGSLAVAHAGLEESMILGASRQMRDFALHGSRTSPDENGKTTRIDWAASYSGMTHVVYGHTVVDEAVWFNRTLCLDTGAVFGGSLSALRWPENEIVSVKAYRAYADLSGPVVTRRKAVEDDRFNDLISMSPESA